MNTMNNISTPPNPTGLAAEWLNPLTKDFLKQRIRTAAKGSIV